jgi:NADH-quinone oxidoreductase subunit K
MRKGFWKHFPLAATVGALIALEMAAVLMGGFRGLDEPKAVQRLCWMPRAGRPYSNTKALGKLLYTEVFVSRGNRRCHFAGGHDCCHCPDAASNARTPRRSTPRCRSVFVLATVWKWSRWLQRQKPSGPKPASQRGEKSMTLTLGHFLTLGAMLFALAVIGIFLNRKNLIVLLMAIELMLLAVNMNFVAFSHYLGDMHGQVFVFFILTVAAAESAIGLAILVLLFRNKSSINAEDLNTLKG